MKGGIGMLISKKLVDLIEHNADELTQKWLEWVRGNLDLPTYHSYDKKLLYDRGFRVYSNLSRWVSTETTREDIRLEYVALGAQRFREGFRLSELIQALIITRRVLWVKIEADGLLDNALDMKSAMDLNNSMLLFFDRAIFFATQGYEKEQASAN
jgi:hypothetical protein